MQQFLSIVGCCAIAFILMTAACYLAIVLFAARATNRMRNKIHGAIVDAVEGIKHKMTPEFVVENIPDEKLPSREQAYEKIAACEKEGHITADQFREICVLLGENKVPDAIRLHQKYHKH